MKIKAILISTGSSSIGEMEIEKGYRQLRTLVGGDVEAISLKDDFSIQMFINDSGKLLHLPLNRIATDLFRAYFTTDDWIAGDAVIIGCNIEGSACDLTEEQIAEIKEKFMGKEVC